MIGTCAITAATSADIKGEYMTCNDPRCDGGYVTLGEYVAADGSVDTHTHPCAECNDASDDEIPF